MSQQLSKCPLCHSSDTHPRHRARDPHYGIKGEFDIYTCHTCGLYFLNPMLSDDELAPMYPTDYYAYQDQFERPNISRVRKLLGLEIKTRDPLFPRPGRILDIGCGTGWFLADMRTAGWETYGVEIGESAAVIAQKQGLDVHAGDLFSAKYPSDFFDYVRSNHSLEHMSNPREVLAEIRRILKPEGKVHIGVPNVDSLPARIFGTKWWGLCPPVHTHGYSPKTLSLLLEQSGFKVERLLHNSNHTGILGSLQIVANQRTGRPASQGGLINNMALKGVTFLLARFLDALHLGDGMEITAVKPT